MSVPNQIPESNYVGNGTTKTFAANFEYASDSDVFVTVNGVAPQIGQATFSNGVFTFTTAPANGAAVRVYRSTPVERDTEYDNHDNVFRPKVVNTDFDRIWYVLQEYLLSLGITNARITQEIADRIQADAEMMNYILNEDNELKADYILRDENLKKYVDQTIGAIIGNPDFQGIEAQFVKDSSGKNQQEINNSLSTAANKLSRIVTPFDFGAFGDGASHKLSTLFATLAAAQVKYPLATSLNDEADWCALQAFFDYCKNNRVENANWGGQFLTNKQLDYVNGHNALTKSFEGFMYITATADMYAVFRTAGSFIRYGEIKLIKSTPSLNIPHGLFWGGWLNSNSSICSTFQTIDSSGFDVASIRMDQNTLFSQIGVARGAGGKTGTLNFTGVISSGSANNQRSTLTVDFVPTFKTEVPKLHANDFVGPNTFIKIDNRAYLVTAVDRTNNTVTIYPQYFGATSGVATYIQGAFFHHGGNNAGCIGVTKISAFGGGIGVSEACLYSGTYADINTEFCGVGIAVGNNTSDPAMNFDTSRTYFEGNTLDYLQVSAWSTGVQSIMQNAVNLNPDKVFALSATDYLGTSGYYENIAGQLGPGVYSIGNRLLSPSRDHAAYGSTKSVELAGTRGIKQYNMTTGGMTINFTVNDRIVELFGASELAIIVKDPNNSAVAPTGNITLNCPSGYVFDTTNATTMTLSDFTKAPIIYAHVVRVNPAGPKRILISVDGMKSTLKQNILSLDNAPKKGTTAQRPTTVSIGQIYFDTTLSANGKPIFYTGTTWVDSTGATV